MIVLLYKSQPRLIARKSIPILDTSTKIILYPLIIMNHIFVQIPYVKLNQWPPSPRFFARRPSSKLSSAGGECAGSSPCEGDQLHPAVGRWYRGTGGLGLCQRNLPVCVGWEVDELLSRHSKLRLSSGYIFLINIFLHKYDIPSGFRLTNIAMENYHLFIGNSW